MSQEVKERGPRRGIFLGTLAVVVTVGISGTAIYYAIYYKDQLMGMAHLTSYGLLGVLIFAFIAGSIMAVVAVPIPYVILVFTMPGLLAPQWGILAPVFVGLIAALGASLGQLLTYMISYGGSNLYQRFTFTTKNRFYHRAMDWARRHGSLAVFVMSAVVNPIHLPMTIAIAALRFPPLKFFFFCLLGNIVKSSFIAFCGYFGLSSLFRFIGI